MRTIGLLLVIAVVMAMVSSGALAQVNLVQNGGFEDPSITEDWSQTPPNAEPTGWTVVSGNVDIVRDTYWKAAEGVQSLDLSGDQPGRIMQSINTVEGQLYKLSFALAGNVYNPPSVKTLKVFWNGGEMQTFTFDTTGKSKDAMGWEYQTAWYTANSTQSTLEFASMDNTYGGPAIDNVSLTAVPEPMSMVLGFMGLSSVAGFKRLRKKA